MVHESKQLSEEERRKALEDYAREYGSALKNYFLKKGAQRSTAEDLSQSVFLRLLARESRQQIDNPKAYLMQTANSAWMDYWRRRIARPDRDHAEFDDWAHSPESFSAERVLEGRQALDLAMATLNSLPDRTRQVYL